MGYEEGGVGWRVVVVKLSTVRDLGPDAQSLEHFHVEFGIDGCTLWYKLMVDKLPDVKEHLMAIFSSNERCIMACRGDEKEFHGKPCLYSPDDRRQLNDHTIVSWLLPLPIPTGPSVLRRIVASQ